jgi:hypothetical protein
LYDYEDARKRMKENGCGGRSRSRKATGRRDRATDSQGQAQASKTGSFGIAKTGWTEQEQKKVGC